MESPETGAKDRLHYLRHASMLCRALLKQLGKFWHPNRTKTSRERILEVIDTSCAYRNFENWVHMINSEFTIHFWVWIVILFWTSSWEASSAAAPISKF